jgi:hypothetical protein
VAVLQHQLPRLAEGGGDRLLQQRLAVLHHRHPGAGHPHHQPLVIQVNQLGLLGEQHAGGGQLKARQDLLPEIGQVDAATSRAAGRPGQSRRLGSGLG